VGASTVLEIGKNVRAVHSGILHSV